MKKYIFYISAAAALGLTGCSKDFIELAPVSQNNVVNFYKTAADMKIAVNAAYGALQYSGQYFSAMHEIAEVRSDNTGILDVQTGLNVVEIDIFTNQSSNTLLNNMWNDHYRGIQQCNIVIDRIDAINMDAATRDRYVGEVKFLRALMYFNMVRTFGDLPLVIKEIRNPEEGYAYTREPVDAVYAQIIADLKEAEAKLPAIYTGTEIGRATSGAAKSLLGKVYLTRKDFTAAAAKLKEVIDGTATSKYMLLSNYEDIFKVTNENHRESIFDVQFKKGGTGEGSPFTNQFAPRSSGVIVSKVGPGLGYNIPTQDMEDAYETGDLRKDLSMANGYMNGASFVASKYIKKYLDVPFQANDADNNWPVLRYADVLLMYAEALNELGYVADGPAFDYLNQIRTRAGLQPKTAVNAEPSLQIADQAAFRLAIEQERRVELAFENHRWFDLVRTDRAIAVMAAHGISIQPYQLLYPIPQSQIDINPEMIKQNPGYQ
ncbi:RagB/SusD family nutrient uptake outer membrane protein [Flavihumibacter stibioxidans]|uniref:Glycan metabolism protein n=1 Tax=Flavihumibacter stibioxidans TaxID=1834163 RepID=A0ABR7M8P9_9BACT|nr:RagB/SusD family nutrient uptake outer membrane protein [Flavihumibacter stibioxidans]MBC6491398.1 glycan metabolism protein [Flavihumibacter stibioxidans]